MKETYHSIWQIILLMQYRSWISYITLYQYEFNISRVCLCEFGKVHCNNTSIHIVSSGHCHTSPSMTLTPLLPGADAIQDFFCTQLSHINCPLTADQMCATDGKTYRNGCEYEKQRCTHRDLHLDYVGTCRV
ncbi:hypothetical protein ACJMK2_010992 [Sinanodonta woodiana]|uniref:Kazal-like domain-containing protein n=1 Tax=Sinanodonta woodiana TaxID=1069815 RepID=A0ABD3V473_SINWO